MQSDCSPRYLHRLLIVILAQFEEGKAHARKNVITRGTTVGPGWVRPPPRLCKYERHQTISN